jgi:hypothetical protein
MQSVARDNETVQSRLNYSNQIPAKLKFKDSSIRFSTDRDDLGMHIRDALMTATLNAFYAIRQRIDHIL